MAEPSIHAAGHERSISKERGSACRRGRSAPSHDERFAVAAHESGDDRAVVGRILAGDDSAFASLVDRHHSSLLRLARAFAQDAAVVDRIVHECWGEILDGLATFRFECSLRTWMLSLVARRARRHADELLASLSGRSEPGAEEVECFDQDGRWVEPPRPWDEHCAAAELPANIADAITRLSSAEQAVLTLCDIERLGHEDTCVVLGIPADAEGALLHSARARLRRALDSRIRAVAERYAITG